MTLDTNQPESLDDANLFDPRTLRARWEQLERDHPKLRIRDAAARLGVGEAQLLSTRLGDGVWRLGAPAKQLFGALERLGPVMASTRNAWAVIEKHGVYDHVDIGDHIGLVLAGAIDLRLFMAHFHSAFIVHRIHRGEPLHSIQFFGRDGVALHKVYAQDEAGRQVLAEFVEQWAHPDQSSIEPQLPPIPGREELPDDEIDVEGFQRDWRAMQDTHEFFGILRAHGVTRLQAMRLAPEGMVARVDAGAIDRVLAMASADEIPIMVFVSSGGCIEIHSGPIARVVETGSWINVLDPDFNLHLNRDGIASSWVVRKPTEDGVVTSLELFDAEGEVIAMCFGERKPGQVERDDWRRLVEGVAGGGVAWRSGSCTGVLSAPLEF